MNTFDRYLFKQFILAFILSTTLLLGLFLIIDFFAKLKAFLEVSPAGGGIGFIFQYYLVRLPVYWVEIMPVITLVAAMLVIIRFMRTNEFIPLLSAGVSMFRLIRPIILGGVFLALIMFATSELIIPPLEPIISRTEKILRFEGYQRYLLSHDKDNNSFVIERYDYTSKMMTNLRMMKFAPAGTSVIAADYALWQDPPKTESLVTKPRGWYLYKGAEYFYPAPVGQLPRKTYDPLPEGYRLETSLTAEDLEKSEKSLAYYRLRELTSLIRKSPHQPHLYLQLYNKFAFPLSALVLLILGIPFLFMSELNLASASVAKGIGICLVVTIAFFSLRFLGESLGMKGTLPAWLAAGGPLFLFALIALLLFRNIKT